MKLRINFFTYVLKLSLRRVTALFYLLCFSIFLAFIYPPSSALAQGDVYQAARDLYTNKDTLPGTITTGMTIYNLYISATINNEVIACPFPEDDRTNQLLKMAFNEYYKKALQGDLDAEYAVAVGYQYSLGVTADQDKAERWYRKAYKQGHTIARDRMAEIYDQQPSKAINLDDEKDALELFYQPAMKGDPAAQTALGDFYREGKGDIQQNAKRALYWYRLAAKQNYGLAESRLGDLYFNGVVINKNYPDAIQWYKTALDNESTPIDAAISSAQNLITIYKLGLGVPVDLDEARFWQVKVDGFNKLKDCRL